MLTDSFRLTTPDNEIILGYKKWVKGSQNRHIHDSYEFQYLVSGERDMFVGDKSVHMTPGDILIIPPNVVHKSFNNYIGSEIYSLYIKKSDSIDIDRVQVINADKVGNLFRRMALEFKECEKNWSLMLRAITLELIVETERALLNSGDDMGLANIKNKKIDAIVKYINQNYKEPLNLAQLSDSFKISEGHLSRSFSRETGFFLTDYINHIRVKKSKEMLKEKSRQISEICFDCGFGSLTNFGRSFKKLTGISPKEYRKSL